MRRVLLATMAAIAMLPASPATADSEGVCWNEVVKDPLGKSNTVTRCRIEGEVVDYGSEGAAAAALGVVVFSPDVGVDLVGSCWFLRTSYAQWVFMARFQDGSALLAWDPGAQGGLVAVEDPFPGCTSEPTEATPVSEQAYEAISDYVHQTPVPDLNPPAAWGGLVNLDIHVGVIPPEPYTETLSIPTGSLTVEAWVGAVEVDWGDGETDTFPSELFSELIGYPDGIAIHTYPTKTCTPAGEGPRCHPDLETYPLRVSYRWTARYSVDDEPWIGLSVPDTDTTTAYDITEIIAVLTSESG